MKVSSRDWNSYVKRLAKLSKIAGEKMQNYIDRFGTSNTTELVNYANALAVKYGEGAAGLACQMYDAMTYIDEIDSRPAEPAPVATKEETAKAVNGSLKQSPSGQLVGSAVYRLVKQAAADTTLKNAVRDGLWFAWVPSGIETCAFCITLASRGWQRASKKTLRKGHAEHIHANCDCQYAISKSGDMEIEGYNPDEYADFYFSQGGSPKDAINSMRRQLYKENKDYINEQKRIAYEKRKGY